MVALRNDFSTRDLLQVFYSHLDDAVTESSDSLAEQLQPAQEGLLIILSW